MNFIETEQFNQAAQMCEAVLGGRQYSRIGQITGQPGTGKTALTHWLADRYGAMRVECWATMPPLNMMQEICKAHDAKYGTDLGLSGTANTFFTRLVAHGVDGKLFIVDEANHLKWKSLELLRGLSDRGAGVIIVGTDILTQTFKHPTIRIYLDQMIQRIGAKKIQMRPIANVDELAAYVLTPRFDTITKTCAAQFYKNTGGNWRLAGELADACARLMENEEIARLDEQVVETATAWLAGQ